MLLGGTRIGKKYSVHRQPPILATPKGFVHGHLLSAPPYFFLFLLLLSRVDLKYLLYQQKKDLFKNSRELQLGTRKPHRLVQTNQDEDLYFMEKEEVGRGCFELKSIGEKQEFRAVPVLPDSVAGVVNSLQEGQCPCFPVGPCDW